MTLSQVFFDNRSYCGEIRREFKKVKILLVFFNDVTEHNPPLGRSKQHYSIKRSKKNNSLQGWWPTYSHMILISME